MSELPWVPVAALALALIGLAALWIDAGRRGWRRIASRFASAGPPPGSRPLPQIGRVGTAGLVQMRGLLLAAATDEGLYLAPPRPMQLTHRPLLIPWDQITVRDEQRRLGILLLTLSIGRVHLGFVFLRGGVAADVVERVEGRGQM